MIAEILVELLVRPRIEQSNIAQQVGQAEQIQQIDWSEVDQTTVDQTEVDLPVEQLQTAIPADLPADTHTHTPVEIPLEIRIEIPRSPPKMPGMPRP